MLNEPIPQTHPLTPLPRGGPPLGVLSQKKKRLASQCGPTAFLETRPSCQEQGVPYASKKSAVLAHSTKNPQEIREKLEFFAEKFFPFESHVINDNCHFRHVCNYQTNMVHGVLQVR